MNEQGLLPINNPADTMGAADRELDQAIIEAATAAVEAGISVRDDLRSGPATPDEEKQRLVAQVIGRMLAGGLEALQHLLQDDKRRNIGPPTLRFGRLYAEADAIVTAKLSFPAGSSSEGAQAAQEAQDRLLNTSRRNGVKQIF